MKKVILPAIALGIAGPPLVACTGDDVTARPQDGGTPTGNEAGPIPGEDSGPDGTLSGDGGARWLLVPYTAGKSGELVAFDLAAKAVAGRIPYPGFGMTSAQAADPFLIVNGTDTVMKLDPSNPSVARGSWDVSLADGGDAGSNANPIAVVGGQDPSKTYVLRYNRNEIAVIDGTRAPDGGQPTKVIDLSSLVQNGDRDGHIDMSAAVYVPSKKRLYVALANIDLFNVDPQGFFLLCSPGLKSTIVAIDTTTDTLVNLDDGGPGGGIALSGVGPLQGESLYYDANNERLVVMSGGCNQPVDAGADAGPGPLVGRIVEAISLRTGAVTQLLDANDKGFPAYFGFASEHSAYMLLGTDGYAWDPASPTLGAKIPNTPDIFAQDGNGNLVGFRTTNNDAGLVAEEIVSVRASDGTVTILGANPFTKVGGFSVGVDLWPPP
jgi:hypothetical protein